MTVGLFCAEAVVSWSDDCGFTHTFTAEVAISVTFSCAVHDGRIVMTLFTSSVLTTVSVSPKAIFISYTVVVLVDITVVGTVG